MSDDVKSTNPTDASASKPPCAKGGAGGSALCAILAMGVFCLVTWQLAPPTIAAYAKLRLADLSAFTDTFVLHTRLWQLLLAVVVTGWVVFGNRMSPRVAAAGNYACILITVALLAVWSAALVTPFHNIPAPASDKTTASGLPMKDGERDALFQKLIAAFNARDSKALCAMMGTGAAKEGDADSVAQNLGKIAEVIGGIKSGRFNRCEHVGKVEGRDCFLIYYDVEFLKSPGGRQKGTLQMKVYSQNGAFELGGMDISG